MAARPQNLPFDPAALHARHLRGGIDARQAAGPPLVDQPATAAAS